MGGLSTKVLFVHGANQSEKNEARNEETWREAITKDEHFAVSETPRYLGRAVTALAADPQIMQRSGQALATWNLAKDYGFTDVDGTQPDWGSHGKRALGIDFG